MPGRPWTREDVRDLRRAVGEGATFAEIADELGRTGYAVKLKSRALGLKPPVGRRPKVDYRLLLVALVDAGLSAAAMARRVGRSHTAVIVMLGKLAREGVVVREGGATTACRYRVAAWWKLSSGKALAEPAGIVKTWLTRNKEVPPCPDR